jgi:hypothetical protein
MYCPASSVTGGPEALHQLCAALRRQGHDAAIQYFAHKQGSDPKPHAYGAYDTVQVSGVSDDADTVVVVPEFRPHYLARFKRAQRCIWWLSVDNYQAAATKRRRSWLYHLRALLGTGEPPLTAPRLMHLVQSQYAAAFLRRQGVSAILPVSDYVNDNLIPLHPRQTRHDIVLFNPKKGLAFTRQLIDAMPDVAFVPLEGLNHAAMRAILGCAKIYIDFGPHPGKDRMPREAARAGCCVLTSLSGSAAFAGDVPIPERYKFEAEPASVPQIRELLHGILSDFDTHSARFDPYRQGVAREKQIFEQEVSTFASSMARAVVRPDTDPRLSQQSPYPKTADIPSQNGARSAARTP